jgi:hypothetical protein
LLSLLHSLSVVTSKMEAAGADAGAKNHLQNALSETEIANLPAVVADKINTYIDHKFEEYLTSKALHETSKTQIGEYPVCFVPFSLFTWTTMSKINY